MIYCDTSLIVATLTQERHTTAANDWFGRQSDPLAVSAWVNTEVASALSMKVRNRDISTDDRRALDAAWERLVASHFMLLTVGPSDFDLASRFAARPDLGLNAGDALHLAIASDRRCALATLDERMIVAARALGLAVHPVRTGP